MRFPFSDHLALIERFLAARQEIAGDLERRLFSAQGKAAAQYGDRESIGDVFDVCFFESPAISAELSALKGQLDAAHLADGFEPVRHDGYSRDLDVTELVLRACHYWDHSRWPGAKGRLAYAQSLYAAFILRQLERLSLRIWDPSTALGASGSDEAAARLRHVQRLLDLLNGTSRSEPEILLARDARWLIQTAQGPLTRHLAPYFTKAARISALSRDVNREIHTAGIVLAGGHLRSQLRHLSQRTGWAFDDPRLLALTRSSNSMDMALLVGDLIPLLEEYETACRQPDRHERLALADVILQGLSADPELLLARLDLLEPSTIIEDLFIDASDGTATYTAAGEIHRKRIARYVALVERTASSLQQDCRAFDPANAPYSPLGIVYGFSADLFSNMVLNTLRARSSTALSLEDLFNSRERLEEKRSQAREWERLPKRDDEPDPFEHSSAWASDIYARLATALDARAGSSEPNATRFRTARLYVVPRGVAIESLPESALPAEITPAQEHCLMSDAAKARTSGATALTADRLAADRTEGRFLACRRSDDGWFAVSKVLLTLYLGQGDDALIVDTPAGVIDVLRMTCPEHVAIRGV